MGGAGINFTGGARNLARKRGGNREGRSQKDYFSHRRLNHSLLPPSLANNNPNPNFDPSNNENHNFASSSKLNRLFFDFEHARRGRDGGGDNKREESELRSLRSGDGKEINGKRKEIEKKRVIPSQQDWDAILRESATKRRKGKGKEPLAGSDELKVDTREAKGISILALDLDLDPQAKEQDESAQVSFEEARKDQELKEREREILDEVRMSEKNLGGKLREVDRDCAEALKLKRQRILHHSNLTGLPTPQSKLKSKIKQSNGSILKQKPSPLAKMTTTAKKKKGDSQPLPSTNSIPREEINPFSFPSQSFSPPFSPSSSIDLNTQFNNNNPISPAFPSTSKAVDNHQGGSQQGKKRKRNRNRSRSKKVRGDEGSANEGIGKGKKRDGTDDDFGLNLGVHLGDSRFEKLPHHPETSAEPPFIVPLHEEPPSSHKPNHNPTLDSKKNGGNSWSRADTPFFVDNDDDDIDSGRNRERIDISMEPIPLSAITGLSTNYIEDNDSHGYCGGNDTDIDTTTQFTQSSNNNSNNATFSSPSSSSKLLLEDSIESFETLLPRPGGRDWKKKNLKKGIGKDKEEKEEEAFEHDVVVEGKKELEQESHQERYPVNPSSGLPTTTIPSKPKHDEFLFQSKSSPTPTTKSGVDIPQRKIASSPTPIQNVSAEERARGKHLSTVHDGKLVTNSGLGFRSCSFGLGSFPDLTQKRKEKDNELPKQDGDPVEVVGDNDAADDGDNSLDSSAIADFGTTSPSFSSSSVSIFSVPISASSQQQPRWSSKQGSLVRPMGKEELEMSISEDGRECARSGSGIKVVNIKEEKREKYTLTSRSLLLSPEDFGIPPYFEFPLPAGILLGLDGSDDEKDDGTEEYNGIDWNADSIFRRSAAATRRESAGILESDSRSSSPSPPPALKLPYRFPLSNEARVELTEAAEGSCYWFVPPLAGEKDGWRSEDEDLNGDEVDEKELEAVSEYVGLSWRLGSKLAMGTTSLSDLGSQKSRRRGPFSSSSSSSSPHLSPSLPPSSSLTSEGEKEIQDEEFHFKRKPRHCRWYDVLESENGGNVWQEWAERVWFDADEGESENGDDDKREHSEGEGDQKNENVGYDDIMNAEGQSVRLISEERKGMLPQLGFTSNGHGVVNPNTTVYSGHTLPTKTNSIKHFPSFFRAHTPNHVLATIDSKKDLARAEVMTRNHRIDDKEGARMISGPDFFSSRNSVELSLGLFDDDEEEDD